MKNILLIAVLLSAAACSGSNGGGSNGGTGGAGATGGSGGSGGTGGTGGGGDRTTPPDDLEGNPSPTTTAAGAPLDEAEVQTIGTAGGTLRFFSDGWRKGPTLVFPAGAVAEDVEISVAPIVSMAPHSIGDAWRFGPEDVAFAKPVEVRFPLPAFSRSPGSLAGVGVAFQNAEGYWQAVADVRVDEETREVMASVDHFSDWTAFQMLELRPANPSVEVGDSVGLWVYKCTTTTAPPSGDDPILVIPTCNAVASELSGWNVNGVPGGSGADGSVTPVMYGAIYTAPDQVPARNPVAVTIDVPLPSGAQGILVSNVDVYDGQPCSPKSPCEWVGTTSWATYGPLDSGEVGLMHEEHASIHWKVQPVTWDPRQVGYDAYGTAVRVDNVNGCYTPDPLVIEAPTRYGTVGVEKLSELRIDYSDPAAPTAWIDAYHGYYADGEICGDDRYEAGFAVSSCDLHYDADLGTISCSTDTVDEDTGVREVWRAYFTRVKLQPE